MKLECNNRKEFKKFTIMKIKQHILNKQWSKKKSQEIF